MVRTALGVGERPLAEQLVDGCDVRHPFAHHSLVDVNARFAEARGEYQVAAIGYADAAERWEQFGVMPEQAFALLGQGGCLAALGDYADAERVLYQAREIFASLKAAPALAEIDTLLQQAGELSA